MTFRESAEKSHHHFALYIVAAVVRLIQFILALTVCGLYGVGLNNDRQEHSSSNTDWVYAEVVGGLSALTALVYMIPFLRTYQLFAWDFTIL